MNRLQLGMMCAAVISIQQLSAQCGRCGDGGGTGRQPSYVVRTSLRTGRPVPLPNSGGTLSAAVTVRSQLVEDQDSIGSVEIALTFSNVTGTATLTGLELRKAEPFNSAGSLLAQAVLVGQGESLAGSGTLRRQGILIPDPGPVDTLKSTYFVRVQVDHGAWLQMALIPTQSEFVAIARLQRLDEAPRDLGNEGTGVFSATVARTASGSIASAEIRFDVQYRFPQTDIGGAPSLGSVGLVAGPRKANEVPTYALNANITNGGPMPDKAVLPTMIRQLSAAENQAEIRTLEIVLANPGSYFFDIQTDRVDYNLGGQLERATVSRVSLVGHTYDNSGSNADALVETYTVRRPVTGELVGGYVTFDWLYRDMPPGETVIAIKPYVELSEIKEFYPEGKQADAKVVDPTLNYWFFKDGLGDRIVRRSTGGLSMRMPLLADSLSLRVLLESRFAGLLITQAHPQGAVQFSSKNLGDVGSGPFISRIEPDVATPGSWVTIYGGGFSVPSQVVIGGTSAVEVQTLGSTQLLARIATDTRTTPDDDRPVVVVDYVGRTSNTIPLKVDIVEPYILKESDGKAWIVDLATRNLVRETTPLKAGGMAEIRTTGFAENTEDSRTINPGITVTVQIGQAESDAEVEAQVFPDGDVAGYWRVRFRVPDSLPDAADGKYILRVIGTWTGPVTGSPTRFPSRGVDVWVSK